MRASMLAIFLLVAALFGLSGPGPASALTLAAVAAGTEAGPPAAWARMGRRCRLTYVRRFRRGRIVYRRVVRCRPSYHRRVVRPMRPRPPVYSAPAPRPQSFGARTGGGGSFFYCANPPCRRPGR